MFQQIEEAVRFVERVAARHESPRKTEDDDEELEPGWRLIELEPHQRKGEHGR
jgi:hypothetical protein